MGKVIFWLVIAFAVLFAVRLGNAAKAKRRGDAVRRNRDLDAQTMVRCGGCGVYLPRAAALPAPGGFRCGAPKCAHPR